jgi:uncharacterized membrane protein
MKGPNRSDAQQRSDDIRVFRAELDRLAAEGILALSDPQAAAVRAHHDALLAEYSREFDIDRDLRAKTLSRGMRITSFLGALALAASVYFLFYQFWGRLGTATQVVILVGAPLVMIALTAWLTGREGGTYFAKLAALVAFASFVLNLSMLGRIFNLPPSDSVLLVWAALAMLLAYTCELRLLLVAGLVCIAGWIAARAGTWGGMYWLSMGERPENFLPAGVLAFVFPLLVDQRRFGGFAATYRVFGLLCVLLTVLVLGNWGEASYLSWPPSIIEGTYQVLGFGLSAGAIWLGARRQWADTVNTGVVFFVVFLYTKFYDWWWEIFPKWLFFLVLALTAVLLLLVFQRWRTRAAHAAGGAT